MSKYEVETAIVITVDPQSFHGKRTVEITATLCHEANRAWTMVANDPAIMLPPPPWKDAPAWQRDSVLQGVLSVIKDPNTTPEASHENWKRIKIADGWVYGEVKDETKKTHPCIVDRYEDLPIEQRAKDDLFVAIAKQGLITFGPRIAYYEPHDGGLLGVMHWRTTNPVMELGLEVILGRMVSMSFAALRGIGRVLGYPVPRDLTSSMIMSIHDMINPCVISATVEKAWDRHRVALFPQVLRSFDSVGPDPIASLYTNASWRIVHALSTTIAELEGVTFVPGYQRWEVSAQPDSLAYVASSKETPTP